MLQLSRQEYELEALRKEGYTMAAIKHCCKKNLGNNPREKFKDCLKKFDRR